MDKNKYPVVAITGSSGAGTTTVKTAFGHVMLRENIKAVFIEGDSFHRYDRKEMKERVAQAIKVGKYCSHFSKNANLIDELAQLFKTFKSTGSGKRRFYLHSDAEAAAWPELKPGQFTPWEEIKPEYDMLFYEGLHGGVEEVVPFVDLLIGVVPIINLEWIQKIQRDISHRGYTAEEVVNTIKTRMDDYVDFITPQFSRTDINFQRIPTVDTSNPFIARDVPSADESLVVIRIKKEIIKEYDIDLTYLKLMLEGSFISRRNTIVVPGPKMGLAMELIVTPIIQDLIKK
ncbi:MAG: phosphoribulokinase [Deferribacteres bacterium]|nr:phosphoribulokinase [candidate division KSB1 bacterium]MCB9503762.1 phosphoribulokinase [Deferribacteres bacterium]